MKRSLFRACKKFLHSKSKSYSYLSTCGNFTQANYSSEESFFEALLRNLKQNIDEDEEYKQDIKDLEDTASMQAIRKTISLTKEGGTYLYTHTEGIRNAAGSVANRSGEFVYWSTDLVGDSIDVLTNTKVVGAIIDELNADYEELKKAHFSFRSEYARTKDAEKGIVFNPYTKQFEQMNDIDLNEDIDDVVISTNKSKSKKKGGFGRVIDEIGGKFFKPTEESRTLTKIKNRNEDFSLELFIGNVENLLMPKVMTAFFDSNRKEIRRYTSTACYKAHIWPYFQEWESLGKRFDSKVLKFGPTVLVSAKIEDKVPIISLRTQVQYIHKIVTIEENEKDEIKILEGSDDDIRILNQHWSFRQDPSLSTNDWEICELYLLHDVQKIAA